MCALKTQKNSILRYKHKINLVKKLYHLGYAVDDIRLLYAFIDSVLMLPQTLDEEFRNDIKEYEEENHMRYITSIERLGRKDGMREGIQKGMQKGIEKGIRIIVKSLLKNKFNHIPKAYLDQLEEASSTKLEHIGHALVFAKTIEEVFEKAANAS